MRRTAILLALAVLITGGMVRAQSPPDDTVAEARVDAAEMGEGDSLTLTIEVRGSRPPHVEEPDLSGLADFNVAAGPSVSTSTSMVWRGGQASSSTSHQYTYILLPRRRGTLTIPTISVKVGNRTLRTDPISVEVIPGRLRQPAPPARGRGGAPGLTPRGTRSREPGEVFVEAQLDRKEAWVGEQILLTYKVYTQVELVELPHPRQLPSYTGFWVEELPNDPRASIRRVVRDGKEFVELTLMKKALFPTTSGQLGIEDTAFELPVRAEGRDPFEGIFFTPTRLVYRKTNPLTVTVKPLPEQGRPASFTGGVGSYTLEASVDRHEARVNEAVGLRVEVRGSGNIKVVGEPVLPPLPDYKRYEPRVEEKRDVAKDQVQGLKTWDYVLTPLAPGQQDLPPIRFAWFDPGRGAYVEVSSPEQTVLVQRGDAGPATMAQGPGAAPGARREVVAFGRDIRFIKGTSDLQARGRPLHRSLTFGALLAAPLALNAALLLAVRRREKRAGSAGLVRGLKAPGFARRRLRAARALMLEGKSRAFSEEVGRALTGYLADKLNVSASGLTHQRIEGLLSSRGVAEPLRQEVRRVLEACDFSRFAPVEQDAQAMRRDFEEAGQLIGRLEREAFGRPRPGPSVRAGAIVVLAAWLTSACGGASAPRAGAADLFAQANELYASGRYEEAIERYRSLVEQGVRSEAVHYNLGNAHYKLNRLGAAILEYERAARLAPLDEDVKANLHLARSLTADKPSEAGARTPSFFLEQLLDLSSVDQDAAAFLAAWMASGFLWGAFIIAASPRWRRWIAAGLIVLAVPLAATGASFGWKVYRARSVPQAVVLRERVDVQSAPGEESVTLFTVHEGLKVDVRQRQAGWWRVQLDNGLNGWVPSDTLEAI